MSRFNEARKPVQATETNYEAAPAYSMSNDKKFATIVLTSMLKDKFYRSGNTEALEITGMIKDGSVAPLFAAKAAVLARHKYGLRSVSHLIAGQIGVQVKGEEWTKDFYNAVIRRVDDITEILGANKAISGSMKIPNSMKKGLAKSFDKFDEYQLAKYRGEGKDIKLIDAVNLLHPVATNRNSAALKKLVNDELRNTKTWEAKQSAAGKAENKVEAKKEAWKEQVDSGKTGYLALIRNIRNIIESSTENMQSLVGQLQNREAIHKSLVMPYQIYIAYKEVQKMNISATDKLTLVTALNQAFKHSVDNVEMPEGETLVAVDSSGSMTWNGDEYGHALIKALPIAIAFRLARGADIALFDSDVVYCPEVYEMEPLAACQHLEDRCSGGATYFHKVFDTAKRAYANVITISDMQGYSDSGWSHPSTAVSNSLKEYSKKFNVMPAVFMIDITGYGTSQFPEARVATIAGFTREALSIAAKSIINPNALVDEINAVRF